MLIIIQELVKRYYRMRDGEHIENFLYSIDIANDQLNLILKYRVLKHIVEQRKKDGYSEQDITLLFADVYYLLEVKNYSVIRNEKEENSFLFVELIQRNTKSTVLVLEVILQDDKSYVIKTGFYRASSKIKKLLRKAK